METPEMKSTGLTAARISIAFSLVFTLVLFMLFRFAHIINTTPTNIFIFMAFASSVIVLSISYLLYVFYGKIESFLLEGGDGTAQYVGSAPKFTCSIFVVVLAGTGLFLELAMIRWHASIFPMFAFYKNFSLLACFAGLGLGYATARSRQVSLLLSLGLLVLQIACMLVLRYGSGPALRLLMASPVAEQTNMGTKSWDLFGNFASDAGPMVIVYGLLILVFSTTVAALIPIGQMTGKFMDGLPKLRAYGLNLLGSVLGVAAFMAISFVWAPPVTWFALAGAVIVLFLPNVRFHRAIGVIALTVMLVLLAWPINPTTQRIYSPYQLIERSVWPSTGLMMILAGGTYYQKVWDFSLQNRNRSNGPLAWVLDYYDLPYHVSENLDRVAIVGSGSGNDVAAALRAGAKEIDAVEIDPVILKLGRRYHPERPYSDSRVTAIIDDARSFFRTTERKYDAIVYAILDSHTALSQSTSVRIDSFVYTLEGFQESYTRLKDGGTFYVSFALLSPSQGPRIYEMMRQASGQEPTVLRVGYDASMTTAFLLRKGGSTPGWRDKIEKQGFEIVSDEYAALASEVDIPTDDWPFFYMKARVYPLSYLPAIALIFFLTVLLGRHILLHGEFRMGSFGFFFLGAGFMLIETKAITELGLLFGSTWVVIAVVIIAVLTMAFLANLAVELFGLQRVSLFYLLLIMAIIFAYFFYGTPFFKDYATHRVLSVAVLTFPILFSGIIFSTQLSQSDVNVSQALGYNILGALFGGLVEYNSLYFGFSFLFIPAALMYLAAMFISRRWLSTL